MLSHIDQNHKPQMVDVSNKSPSFRQAKARSHLLLPRGILQCMQKGDIMSVKGPVFQTAIIAGTMAVKKTAEMIPFCHPLPIEGCEIDIALNNHEVTIYCLVTTHHKTGVEMEALVGVSTAALTIYDMCKSFSHDIVIKETRLIEKSGGKSS